MDKEAKSDYVMGNNVARMWPYPRIVYMERPSGVLDKFPRSMGKKRLFYDMFFPEQYTEAEYVGFVDTSCLRYQNVRRVLLYFNCFSPHEYFIKTVVVVLVESFSPLSDLDIFDP